MTQIVIHTNDDEKASLLVRFLYELDFVTQVDTQTTNADDARRRRILNYAGSWSNLTEEKLLELQNALMRTDEFFPERDVKW